MAFSAQFDLSSLNGRNGFVITGDNGLSFGGARNSRGDFNGDGIDDLVFNAGFQDTGRTYVIYGSRQGFQPSFNLSSVNGVNGFFLNSERGSAGIAGDINNDGVDDLVKGIPYWGMRLMNSTVSVVLGSRTGFDFGTRPSLGSLPVGSRAFFSNGGSFEGYGSTVSTAGDINGDGIDDLIIASRNSFSTRDGVYLFRSRQYWLRKK